MKHGTKRILTVVSRLGYGGTEQYLLRLLREHGLEMDFLVYSEGPDPQEETFKKLGARVYHVPGSRRHPLRFRRDLDAFFREHAADYSAVYLNSNSFTFIYPLTLAKKYGIPVRAAHCHNTSTRGLHNRLFHRLNRLRIHRIATDFLACSPAAARYGFGRHADQTRIVANTADSGVFKFSAEARERIRREFGIPADALVIGAVGRLVPEKNHRFLINLLKSAVGTRHGASDVLLLLVGDGPERGLLERLAEKAGVSDRVIFTGDRDDIPELLSAMDIFCMPSLHEGFGIAALEAATVGLPLILSPSLSQAVPHFPVGTRHLVCDITPAAWLAAIQSMAGEKSGEGGH